MRVESGKLHGDHPVAARGPRPERAACTLLCLHGRGASPESILQLVDELALPDVAAIAPRAAGFTWYPQSFLAPLALNQPWLDSALQTVETLTRRLIREGVPSERIALLGFSQGACLALEAAVRNPRRYGAVIGFAGGLIGPANTPRDYPGSLEGTPVLLGAGDPDPHVPFWRILETKEVLEKLGAVVDLRRYPGMAHSINEDELFAARRLLVRISDRAVDI